jgi:hypothetical protein
MNYREFPQLFLKNDNTEHISQQTTISPNGNVVLKSSGGDVGELN